MERDIFLRVQDAMTEEERGAFLKRLYDLNPNMRGAHVADLLDMLYDHDAALDFREAVRESAGAQENLRTLDICALAAYYSSGLPSSSHAWKIFKRVR